MSLPVIFALIFAGIGAVLDEFTGKLPNSFCFCGWCLGLGLWAGLWGSDGVFIYGKGFLILLFPGVVLYLLGAIGAGDAKMLTALGGMLGWRRGMRLMWYTLLLAAIYGIFRIIKNKEGKQVLLRWRRYGYQILWKHQFSWKEEESIRIPLAAAAFAGVVLLALREIL